MPDIYGNLLPGETQYVPEEDQAIPPDNGGIVDGMAGGGGGGGAAPNFLTQMLTSQPGAAGATPSPTSGFEQFQNFINPPVAPPVQEKTPALAYILGGLQDALSLASHSRTKQQKYRLLGRKHERYITGPREVQQSAAPPIGQGLASAFFGPRIQHHQEMQAYQKAQAARQQAVAPEMAKYAMAAMVPQRTPQAQAYDFVSQKERSGDPAWKGATAAWVQKFTAQKGSPEQLSADERHAQLRADIAKKGDKAELAAFDEHWRITKQAGRAAARPPAGRMSPQEKADAAGLVLERKINVMRDQGLIGPDQHRTATAITSHYGPQITQLQAELAALNKEARAGNYTDPQTGAIGPDPMTLNRINIKQRQLNDLQAKRQSALDAVLRSSGVNVESFLSDTAEQPALEGDGAAGADMGDPELPDGSHVSEWEQEDWDNLQRTNPAQFDQYQAIAQGASQ